MKTPTSPSGTSGPAVGVSTLAEDSAAGSAKPALLGELLVRRDACSEEEVQKALTIQDSYGGKIGTILINMGIITEEQLLRALAEQLDLPYRHDVSGLDIESVELPAEILLEHGMMPVGRSDGHLRVLTNNPLNLEIATLLEGAAGLPVACELTREENIKQLGLQLETGDVLAAPHLVDIDSEVDRLKELASEAPVIKLVNGLLARAVEQGASDIHFEAMRKAMKVRMRIDGMLQIADTIPRNLEPAVIARLKLIANMNIAENRLPQDGRISVRIGGEEIDIRASSVPTQFGESFVVRLLGKETVELAIDRIGLYPDQCGAIRQVLANPNGVFLTTGPTGSGKTTTLYAMLSELSDEHNKVVTVENPVEYELSSASQINIRPEIDYTFAKALRSILRQDPDIIMVGEIRDLETAEIAVQAALTGHLVFSTLHTNNALDSITRLLDMGVERFLLKACICGLMAQRLVRRLCPACAAPEAIRAEMRRAYDLDALLAAHPFVTPNPQAAPGCDHCGHSGHKGRQVIAEILPCDAGTAEIFDADSRRTITDFGVRNILQDGLLKVLEGQTSLDEVLRVSR